MRAINAKLQITYSDSNALLNSSGHHRAPGPREEAWFKSVDPNGRDSSWQNLQYGEESRNKVFPFTINGTDIYAVERFRR